ncbi:MAG: efflux RND transporter permease subunit [Deltaproteobacteria bacterium]|nr:efflux RND transporter permease subunit [Deltaproteobacteria bacterium]
MTLPEFGVRRPVAAIMVFLAVVVIGVVALTRLNMDLMPKFDLPVISVITIYRGAGPKEVEQRVTKVLETQLATVTDLDRVESTSQENASIITLRFDWGTDLTEAANEIRDKLSLAKKRLPDGADEPYMMKLDMSQMPILMLGISASGPSRRGLKKLIEDKVADPLKRLPGVATVMVMGGAKRQVRVELDQRRLQATGIGLDQVMGLLASSNLNVPGGVLDTGRTSYTVRVPAEFESPAQIGQLVVGQNPRTGAPVHLADVAHIVDGPERATQFLEANGHTAVGLMIAKQSGANTVEVTKRVRAELKRMGKQLPRDLQIVEIKDYSKDISNTVDNLKETILWGGILVLLVVLLFLRNLRGSLIVALSIPTSLVVTFALMFMMGYTLNMISLTSLAIAIGMVVDDSIVVLENIHRHRTSGARALEGASEGASEVGMAVTASTLSTLAIFLPVVFLGGIVGIFFTQLAAIVSMALIASLAVSLILVPTLSSRLLVVKPPSGVMGWLFRQSERIFDGLERGYGAILGWALRHRVVVITGIVAVCGASLVTVPYLKTEFMPEQDTGSLTVSVEMPVGTRHEITGRIVRRINERLRRAVPETRSTMSMWGSGEEGQEATAMLGMGQGPNYGIVMATLGSRDKRARTTKEVAKSLRPFLATLPATRARLNSGDPMQTALLGGARPITVEVRGHDEKIAARLARRVAAGLKRISGITDVDISRKEGVPELDVHVDRDKAAALGLNIAAVAMTVRNAFNGVTVSKYRVGGDEYDIFVRLRPEDRSSPDDLAGLTVKSMLGKTIRLENVARIVRSVGPEKIERKNQERLIYVGADIEGRDLGSVAEDVRNMVDRIQVPPGFSLRIGGAREEQQKSFHLLYLALLLGIALVYIVMAAQFESLRDPFIILFAIPFAIVGALWAFVLTGQTLSVLSFIGVIMLVGIVVKNGIVLVDYINILRARGLGVTDAVRQGGRHRLRPVLMTALTTILGMLPLAMSRGEGAEMWNALATAVIGGLAVSTVITLIFVPTLYAVFEQGRERRLARKRARIAAAVTPAEESL